MKDIKVRVFKCLCGDARMLAVIDPDGKPFSKESKKEQKFLLEAGCDVETLPLETARGLDLCFDCKL